MSSELDRRLRENKGRRIWADLARLLSVILDREVDAAALLTLDATDALRKDFRARLRRGGLELERNHGATAPIWDAVERLASEVPDIEVVLLHENDRYTGAIRVKLRETLRHARRVWGAVGGDFCVTTAAAADGLYLGSYHVHPGDALELIVWGLFARADLLGSG